MLDAAALDTLFVKARTHQGFTDDPITDADLERIWDLAKWGPTAANCVPLRVAFVRSEEAKKKLEPCLDAGNVAKTMAAPVTAIFAWDAAFYEHMPKLFPHINLRDFLAANPPAAETMGRQSATLQIGYFIVAARAAGFSCGPMGGFNQAKVDAAFFAGTAWRSLILCNLGKGDPERVYPRGPRIEWAESCKVL
jgi:3-hydroxypropanoate dehydrogenase